MSDYISTFKILLLNHSSFNKEFVDKYLQKFFKESANLTIGVEFYIKTVQLNEKNFKLQVWDMDEPKRSRFLLPSYCRGANGVLLMYDITDSGVFDIFIDYIQIIRDNAGNIPIILVGNNIDREDIWDTTLEEGIKFAEKNDFSAFIEISTKTGQNVQILFDVLTKRLTDLKRIR